MDYEKLKEVIAKKIKENGRGEITGPVLQAVLMAMVDSLGEAYPQTYTDEQKAQARANIDALSDYDGEITKEKLSIEVQAILNDVANKQNISDATLATIAKTIVGAINEVYNGGLKDASIATSKIKDGAITEPKLDTDLLNIITSAVQPADLASAIATALASYVAKADIVSTTGSATDKVMSQHGVTEAINGVNDKVTELDSQIEAETTARTEADAELQTQINGKQEALTLTVKDNGNIVIANIQGQSKEFMPATPSGDPMHYAYVAAGAKYNDTGKDIVKTTPWADLADDDADKTVVHKAGYWYLNGLGDITNQQMRNIYSYVNCFASSYDMSEAFYEAKIRTNINLYHQKGAYGKIALISSFNGSSIEVANFNSYLNVKDIRYIFAGSKIKYIIGDLLTGADLQTTGAFTKSNQLKILKIKGLASSLSFINSLLLSVKSVLYMINNEKATSPITITLHTDVYNRCMANEDILAALKAHTNVSLASA